MPLPLSRLPRELQAIRLWASSGTSANTIAAEQARKRALAEHFNPKMPREDRKLPHPLIQKLAKTQQHRKMLQREPPQIAVQRMAEILRALDKNRGKPLGQIFRRKTN